MDVAFTIPALLRAFPRLVCGAREGSDSVIEVTGQQNMSCGVREPASGVGGGGVLVHAGLVGRRDS